MRALGWVTASALGLASCGGAPAEPSATPPIVALRVDSPLSLGVGEQVPIRVTGVAGDGSERDVSGIMQWTLNGQAASVTSEGELQGRTPGSATLRGLLNNAVSTEVPVTVARAASVVPEGIVAEWSGTATLTGCRGLVITGPGSCRIVGLVMPWQANIRAAGGRLQGTLQMYNVRATGPISGFTTLDGLLLFAGVLRADQERHVSSILLSELRVTDGTMQGRMILDRTLRNFFGLILDREEHQVTARRMGG